MIKRAGKFIQPDGATKIQQDDHLLITFDNETDKEKIQQEILGNIIAE